MQILGNIFYIVLFVSVIGTIFCVLSLFINHALRCTLPLWFSLCGMTLFCVPFLSPDVFLISPEEQEWFQGFYWASKVWICGCGILMLYHAIRFLLAKRAMKRYLVCNDTRFNEVCSGCADAIGLQNVPTLYWGTLHTPICVTGIMKPAIIMNKAIIEQLTEVELTAVFTHELTHIKRKHLLWEWLYQYVCILNWINPFVWIAKADFSLHCETDCDGAVLKLSKGKIKTVEYTSSIIRLLELSTMEAAKSNIGIGALNFIWTKRRLKRITQTVSKIQTGVLSIVLAVCIALIVIFSLQFSREHFYPYPAYQVGTEYHAGYAE